MENKKKQIIKDFEYIIDIVLKEYEEQSYIQDKLENYIKENLKDLLILVCSKEVKRIKLNQINENLKEEQKKKKIKEQS